MAGKRVRTGDIYLEFHVIGNSVKVSAVDAASGTEVSITGPRTANRKMLEITAINKLKYVMNKE